MKITLEVPDITTAAVALNHACAAYGRILYTLSLGLEIPAKFDALRDMDDETIMRRFNCLTSMYKQVEEIEKQHKNNSEV